jgi:hypothetical protein
MIKPQKNSICEWPQQLKEISGAADNRVVNS